MQKIDSKIAVIIQYLNGDVSLNSLHNLSVITLVDWSCHIYHEYKICQDIASLSGYMAL